MKLLTKEGVLLLALMLVSAPARAALSGTVYLADDPHIAYGPLSQYFENDYEPLNNSTNIASSHFDINLAAYVYANYEDSEAFVFVKINGREVLRQSYDVPPGKPSEPNVIFTGQLAESLFNVGDNDVEYYMEYSHKEEGKEEEFFYKFHVTRTASSTLRNDVVLSSATRTPNGYVRTLNGLRSEVALESSRRSPQSGINQPAKLYAVLSRRYFA